VHSLNIGTSQGGKGFKALKTLRTVRALRPLRLISRTEGVKECLDCIIAALPDIGQVSIVIVLLSLWYSIFGVTLYRGAFYTCSESDKMDLTPVTQFLWDNATINVADWLDCMGGAAAVTNVSWRHEELHFDEVGAGMR
jgi:hypothetical protein